MIAGMDSNSATYFEQLSPVAGRSLLLAAAVSLALAFVTQSGPLLKPYLVFDPIKDIPYARAAITTALDFGVFLILLRLAGLSFSAQADISGVFTSIARPSVFALLTLGPATAVCAAFVPLALTATPADVAWKVFVGPFTEEVAFRGLAVGVLMRACGWPLIPACVWPAAFFGAAHAWHGSDLAEVAGIVGITAAGGLLFGWLFARWNFNLWPSVFLHAGLNGLWLLFALGENAIGGWFGNGVRFGTVALAILVTLSGRAAQQPASA